VAGWKYKSNQELVGLCSKGWKALSPEQKNNFDKRENKANTADSNNRRKERKEGGVGRYDSHGNPLVSIKKRDAERVKMIEDKVKAVSAMVEKASRSGTIETIEFNILETHVFVKIEEKELYVPAEISIAKFSLQEGVSKVFHAFPEAGPIPLGYKRECMDNIKKVHKIPYDKGAIKVHGEDDVECNHSTNTQILKDISEHLTGTEKIVFCMPERLAQCEGVLRTLCDRSSLKMPVDKFLPLPELLFMLANSSKEGNRVPSAGVAEGLLDSEKFLFNSGLSCNWHEVMTDTNTCTSATARRLCYSVLDLCCQFYRLPLIPGKHIPTTVDSLPLVGKEWSMPRLGVRNTVARRQGDFAAEDVRLRDENKNNINKDKKPEMDSKNSTMPPDTISDYMGAVTESVSNLSVLSDSSSVTEFVTIDSMSEVAHTLSEVQVQPRGVGRGSMVPGRRMSRIAATFPGVKKDE